MHIRERKIPKEDVQNLIFPVNIRHSVMSVAEAIGVAGIVLPRHLEDIFYNDLISTMILHGQKASLYYREATAFR